MPIDPRVTSALGTLALAWLGAACAASSPAPAAERAGVLGSAPEPVAVVTLPPPAPREEPLAATPAPSAKVSSPQPDGLTPQNATAKAPPVFTVAFETSEGPFSARCHKAWAPRAADRFYNLVKLGYFDDTIFFRVIKTPQPFVVQWGIHGDPAVNQAWQDAKLSPDPVTQTNRRGTLTFAMGGSPSTFTTQVFVNLADNGRLDAMGFAPVCEVDASGMKVFDALFGGYEGKPSNEQARIQAEGNVFLRSKFPELDFIQRATLAAGP